MSLGFVLEQGRGAPKDRARAQGLYRQSCAAGDALGCNDLAVLLAARDSPKDVAEAAELLSKACNAGLPEACVNRLLLESRGNADGTFLGATSRAYTR